MNNPHHREVPDYLGNYFASLRLVDNIRQHYARLNLSPKVWVEEVEYPGIGGKTMHFYQVRSSIRMKAP